MRQPRTLVRRASRAARARAGVWAVVALVGAHACGEPTAPVKQPPVDLDAVASPTPADFSAEATLNQRYAGTIAPHFDSVAAQTFAGVDGVAIRYRAFLVTPERAAVVLLPGKAEPMRKYAEIIWDLNRQGFSVYAMDWRGQGESGRMVPNVEMEYVRFFQDYVDDLDAFVRAVVRARAHPAVFVLAHSMGAAAATLYIHAQPSGVTAAAFSSPMYELVTGSYPESVAGSIAYGACSRGSGQGYAIGEHDFDDQQTFAQEDATHSQARFDMKMLMYRQHPDVRIGGVSWQWLCESLTATGHIRTLGRNSPVPMLVFQAGEDVTVRVDAQTKYCDAAPRCQLVRFPTARHEILMETDDIRNSALALAVRYFDHFTGGTP